MRNLFIFAILLMVGCGSKTDDMFSDAREKLKEDKIIEAFDAYRKCITAENDFAKAKELEEDEVKTNPYMRDAK
jgi:uncharacterized protein YcfL